MIILLDRQVLATVNAATGKGITSYVAVYADGALAATDRYVLATYGTPMDVHTVALLPSKIVTKAILYAKKRDQFFVKLNTTAGTIGIFEYPQSDRQFICVEAVGDMLNNPIGVETFTFTENTLNILYKMTCTFRLYAKVPEPNNLEVKFHSNGSAETDLGGLIKIMFVSNRS